MALHSLIAPLPAFVLFPLFAAGIFMALLEPLSNGISPLATEGEGRNRDCSTRELFQREKSFSLLSSSNKEEVRPGGLGLPSCEVKIVVNLS